MLAFSGLVWTATSACRERDAPPPPPTRAAREPAGGEGAEAAKTSAKTAEALAKALGEALGEALAPFGSVPSKYSVSSLWQPSGLGSFKMSFAAFVM